MLPTNGEKCLPDWAFSLDLRSFPRRTGRSKVLWNRHFVAFPELRRVDAIGARVAVRKRVHCSTELSKFAYSFNG